MEQLIRISENGLLLVIEVTKQGKVNFLHFADCSYIEAQFNEEQRNSFNMVEIKTSDEGYTEHHGMKHRSALSAKLRYVSHTDCRNQNGRIFEILQQVDGIYVTSHFQFYDNIKAIRSWTTVKNKSDKKLPLEYISSFVLLGMTKEGELDWNEKSVLSVPHNTWCGEAQWQTESITKMGLNKVGDFSIKALEYSSTGTWSASRYLPMGHIYNNKAEMSLMWQVENNGSWTYEIGDYENQLYLQISGPCEDKSHWFKELKPNEEFVTVPCAVSAVSGGFDRAMEEMTKYRRAIRRKNDDNEKLAVIFNDYMNCLFGDPTTAKLIPLIDAAAKAGCEYFCIDCGWYSDGKWWDGVGEWLPSLERFPNGINEPIDYIKKKGMIPGLWLEIEVVGINCPLAKTLPDDYFFMRHGRRVVDNGRYQLNFNNPAVREHATGIVKRLVEEYGAGYIKMDYNINAGIGSEVDSDSFGDGLLKHNRSYLGWIDSIFEKYPELIIENCSSGGMRMDYSMLSRHSIQSSSDQTDYIKNAVIAVAAPSGVCPEQCAVWSYPLRDSDPEQVAMNMINAMLLRIHQSGHLAEISDDGFELVAQGIEVYKSIRHDIKNAIAFWPLGLPHFGDGFISLGLKCGDKRYLSVYRLCSQESECEVPLEFITKSTRVKCIYPVGLPCEFRVDGDSKLIKVNFDKKNMARLFEIGE